MTDTPEMRPVPGMIPSLIVGSAALAALLGAGFAICLFAVTFPLVFFWGVAGIVGIAFGGMLARGLGMAIIDWWRD